MSEDMARYGGNKREQMNEKKEPNQIINRHKARILQNLEDAGCPVIFRDAVTAGLNWLRSDINENERNGDRHGQEASGNH